MRTTFPWCDMINSSLRRIYYQLQIKCLHFQSRVARDKARPVDNDTQTFIVSRGKGAQGWVQQEERSEGHVGGKNRCEQEQTTKSSGGDKSSAHNVSTPSHSIQRLYAHMECSVNAREAPNQRCVGSMIVWALVLFVLLSKCINIVSTHFKQHSLMF